MSSSNNMDNNSSIPLLQLQRRMMIGGGLEEDNNVVDYGAIVGGAEEEEEVRQRRQTGEQGGLTDDEIDIVLANLEEEEEGHPSIIGNIGGVVLGKKTLSRYLVENFLAKNKWYNPNVNNPNAPRLEKGWAYFEHFTLPRRFAAKSGGHHTRASPGEKGETKLYSVWGTSQEDLSDWGIGMGMYFSSLKAVSIIFVLAGILNVANMWYYSGHGYDDGDARSASGMPLWDMLRFSAICTDREWVVCAEGCDDEVERWDSIFANKFYGTATDADTGEKVTLIQRTTCLPAQFAQGMVNYGTMVLLILCMLMFMWYLSRKEIRFDEDNTTAGDYTIAVHNPPPDAVDPDEWRDFFDRFSDKSVTLCTVALNNHQLLAKLVQRRKDIRALKRLLPAGIKCNFDDEKQVDTAVENARRYRKGEEGLFTPLLRSLGFSLTEDMIWSRIKATTKEIKELQQKEYQAAVIYLTFETEEGQRTALEACNASEMEVLTNKPRYLDSSALFQGKVLRVEEASEPTAVRWRDVHYTRRHIYFRQTITFGITLGLCFLSAYVLQLCRLRVDVALFSVILTTFNVIIPIIVRILVSYEKHYDEGGIQVSLYIKITFFRWVNTAIITRLITPFLATLGEESIDLISTVNALMISEMIVPPLLRYIDFVSLLKRHFLAPRAKTEEELYSCFSGGKNNLAERYTDFTKVLLLCTFYSAFYPLIYLLGAAILFGHYWMDKFLLLRSWQKAPNTGTRTAKFSRTYFNTAAILLGAISSGYAYARSPFTFLCSCTENGKDCTIPDTQEFTDVVLKNEDIIPFVQTGSKEGFYFCNQQEISFPPVPDVQGSDRWMTDSQEQLSRIYGMSCLILLILYCVFVLGQRTVSAVLSLVRGVYKPSGFNQHKDFSSGIGFESYGYIPQLKVPGFHLPLLACNIDDVDVRLIGWKDPNCRNEVDPHRTYDDSNLIFDVPHEKLHRSRNMVVDGSVPRGERNVRPIFSVVKHYPPEWAR